MPEHTHAQRVSVCNVDGDESWLRRVGSLFSVLFRCSSTFTRTTLSASTCAVPARARPSFINSLSLTPLFVLLLSRFFTYFFAKLAVQQFLEMLCQLSLPHAFWFVRTHPSLAVNILLKRIGIGPASVVFFFPLSIYLCQQEDMSAVGHTKTSPLRRRASNRHFIAFHGLAGMAEPLDGIPEDPAAPAPAGELPFHHAQEPQKYFTPQVPPSGLAAAQQLANMKPHAISFSKRASCPEDQVRPQS
jgi:hypothetical protein